MARVEVRGPGPGVDKSTRQGKGRRRSRWKLKVGVKQEGVPGGIQAPLEPLSTLFFPGNRGADVEVRVGPREGLYSLSPPGGCRVRESGPAKPAQEPLPGSPGPRLQPQMPPPRTGKRSPGEGEEGPPVFLGRGPRWRLQSSEEAECQGGEVPVGSKDGV